VREDESTIVTIPTELTRRDIWWIVGIGGGIIMYSLYLMVYQGQPPALCLSAVVLTIIWMLSKRPMTEVQGFGAFAVLMRNRLGERDIHEWVLAFLHYVNLVHVPVWRAHCVAFWRLCRQRIASWQAPPSVRMRWSLSRVSSWGYRIRSSLSHKPAK
jgi:hypothetical protein